MATTWFHKDVPVRNIAELSSGVISRKKRPMRSFELRLVDLELQLQELKVVRLRAEREAALKEAMTRERVQILAEIKSAARLLAYNSCS